MPSVLLKARPVSETEPYAKLLLYGDKGAGKTYLAGGAPKPLFFDFERSTETLRQPQFAHVKKLQANVDFTTVDQLKDTIYDAMNSGFETLVFDTVTRMQVWQVREYMEDVTDGGKKREMLIPWQGDFRYSLEWLDSIFEDLQNAPIHVIFNAHERADRQPGEQQGTFKITRIYPDLTPALASRLSGLTNVVGYLTSKPNPREQMRQERKLQVNPGLIIEAKNRLGIAELEITNPTFDKLLARKENNAD